ncbi:MAG TPA: hypothetical protein VN451_07615, partial [Chitinophagaceae bacterium]|nr:hypothetical protein [Chitinophagaceae bacterium]
VIGVSQPIVELMGKLHNRQKKLIFNGYEDEIFNELSGLPTAADKFTITIIGNLYQGQDIPFMAAGFNKFTSLYSDTLVQFLGTAGSAEKIVRMIKENIAAPQLLITDMMERKEALQKATRSHVMYYIGWKGYRGIYSGKIFEYLGLQRNILLAPSDKDVIEELIIETQAGKFVDTIEEMVDALSVWYREWKQTGAVAYKGKIGEIKKYTRERQAEILAKEILAI